MFNVEFTGFSCGVPQEVINHCARPFRLFEQEDAAAQFASDLAIEAVSILCRTASPETSYEIKISKGPHETVVCLPGGEAHWTVEQWTPEVIIKSSVNDIPVIHGFSSINEMLDYWDMDDPAMGDSSIELAIYKGEPIVQAARGDSVTTSAFIGMLSRMADEKGTEAKKRHIQDVKTQYGFTLEYVERQLTKLDGLRDWYKWNSDDGRFTVCCDDACDGSGRHTIHIYQTGEFKYRPEVYVRTNDNTGALAGIVIRRGSDDGGLTSQEQLDAYINELVVTQRAVEAIQTLFIDGWSTIKAKVELDFSLARMLGLNRLPATNEEFWAELAKLRNEKEEMA